MTWNSSLIIGRTGSRHDHGMSPIHLERPSDPSYGLHQFLSTSHELRHLDLSNRNLRDAKLIRGSSCYASSFAHSCMWRVQMEGVNFGECDFRNADLCGANFLGASFDEADFINAVIDTSTVLSRAYLYNANGIYRLPVGDERGYEPYAIWHTSDSQYGVGWLIFAGCRVLNVKNALAHWTPDAYASEQETDRRRRYTEALRWLDDQPLPDLVRSDSRPSAILAPPEEVTPIENV